MALADLPLDMIDAGLEHLLNWPFEDEEALDFKVKIAKNLVQITLAQF